ncbi:hypothetical protein [Pseudarthrobacter sp. H2]|uniref:hypothetical protein n=1 Tax=Pseudarthrobacter sp. H2 TaxID=3418415 RepID=UPI003CEE91EF
MSAAAPAGEGRTVPARDPDRPSPPPGRLLPEAIRMLSAFAGLGAGTLSFGISSTLLTSAGSPWSWAGALAAAVWGIVLTAWAIQSLHFGNPVWSGVMIRLVAVSVLMHIASVIHGIWWVPASARSLDVAGLSALALELALVGSVGWLARHGARRGAPAAISPSAGRLLPAIFAAALAVAAVTTPGLAATAAGQHTVPPGEHGSPQIQSPAGHHH